MNVATGITAQGRSLVSAAGVQFEMFLNNNVLFGSLNEVVMFIDNIRQERTSRIFRDSDILDRPIGVDEVFYKVAMTCGHKWYPTDEELQVIWDLINNLDQEDLNRIYYKNNLFEFMKNVSMDKAIKLILTTLKTPYMDPMKPPKEIAVELDAFKDIIMEYVYYGYQIIDRVDRMNTMTKSVCLVSDTDSTFISTDGWYRFILDKVKGMNMDILKYDIDLVEFMEMDEFGDPTGKYENWNCPIEFEEIKLDYDFYSDKVIELEHSIDPLVISRQDNLRYSIINVLCYILDSVINAYMIDFTKQTHSFRGEDKCMIIMKNEFLNMRTLLTMVKKNYAAVQEIQEGKYLGEGGVMDIKGIQSMAKSSIAERTRKEQKKILYEEILNNENINQLQVIKRLAILEKQIYESIKSGSKEYYKPAAIKSIGSYEDPMRIQGIKASFVWNEVRDKNLEAIDLSIRNGVDIVKVKINRDSLEAIRYNYPEEYEKLLNFVVPGKYSNLNGYNLDKIYKGNITSIAIPRAVAVPKWVLELVDYETIIIDNISGFPLESIGISKLNNKNVIYTNMLKL